MIEISLTSTFKEPSLFSKRAFLMVGFKLGISTIPDISRARFMTGMTSMRQVYKVVHSESAEDRVILICDLLVQDSVITQK